MSNIKKLLEELIEPLAIVARGDETKINDYYTEHEEEINAIYNTLIWEMVTNPDFVIEVDYEEKRLYKTLFKIAHRIVTTDVDELSEKLLFEILPGEGWDYDFAWRLKSAKPIIVAKDLPDDTRTYFIEAHKAYLWGVDRGAILLCWAGFEHALKNIASDIDDDIAFRWMKNRPEDRKGLIREILNSLGERGRLTGTERETVRSLMNVRDHIIHKEFSHGIIDVDSKRDYLPEVGKFNAGEYIHKVIEIVEKLYQGSAYS